MSTTTPNLTLTLYDTTTDQAVTFATFRAVWGGTATTSNFYRIDTWAGTVNSAITTLQNQRGATPVSASYISANYYEASVGSIASYISGMTIVLSVDTTSSGTVTLNINSLGTKSVMKVDSTGTPINLTGSDLVDGRQYLFMYDGTRWLWVSANSADQIQIVGTAGNVVTVGSTNNLDGSVTPSSLISSTIHNATTKSTPVDNDDFGIADSEASYALKSLSFGNLKSSIKTYYDSVSATLANKTLTSPVISTISNTGTLTLPTSTDTLVGKATTDILTNKTLISTTNTIEQLTTATSSATHTMTGGSLRNRLKITAQAEAMTIAEPSGTPADGNMLMIMYKDNGSARAITWDGIFIGYKPVSTIAGKWTVIVGVYNSTLSKYMMSLAFQEA